MYGQVLKMKSCLPEVVLDENPYGGRHHIVGNIPDVLHVRYYLFTWRLSLAFFITTS